MPSRSDWGAVADGDPTVALLPVEGLETNYAEISEEHNIHPVQQDIWSEPDVNRTPVVIATVGLFDGPPAYDDRVDWAEECAAWDSGYQREIIDGVTVYNGGDLCDSEESDWEDPFDIAGREYVDQYNFDLLEGMEPMVFVPGGDPSRSDLPDDVETGMAHVCQTTLYNPHGVLDGVDVMANAFGQEIPRIASGFLRILAVTTGFLRMGMIPGIEREIPEARTMSQMRLVKEILGWTGVIRYSGMHPFHSDGDDPLPHKQYLVKVASTKRETRLLGRPQPQMYPPVALNQYVWVNRIHKHFIYTCIYILRLYEYFEIYLSKLSSNNM